MDIKLKREVLTYYAPIYTGRTFREDAGELVVPDTMPDIARILDADAAVFVHQRTVSDGRVTLEGEIQGSVVYLGEEDTGLQRVELRMPCALMLEDERIQSGDELTAEVCVQSADARALNPRKVALRAETVCTAALYRQTTLEIPSDVEEGELQILIQEKKVGYAAGVEEKSFVVSEELALPAACPALAKLLRSRVSAEVGEQKSVGGKMILQGNVQLEIQYLGEGEEEPRLERFSVPFSQIMDAPEGYGGTASIKIAPDACYVEPMPGSYGAGSLHMEVHLLAQAVFLAEKELRYIADAYSVRYPCALEFGTVELSGTNRPVSLRETVREGLETPDSPAEAIYGYASASVPEVQENGLALPVSVHALYRTERGQLSAVSRTLTAELPAEGIGSREVLTETPICGEPYLTVSGPMLEARLPVEVRADVSERERVEYVSAIELMDEQPLPAGEAPALTLVRWGGESFWSLAKRFGSTDCLVAAANPSAAVGDLLLIPRAR